jgi:hypothetical protein
LSSAAPTIYDYNGNLWTVRPELIGSLFVFVIDATAGSRRLRSLCFIALALSYVGDYTALFPVGALLLPAVFVNASAFRHLTVIPSCGSCTRSEGFSRKVARLPRPGMALAGAS